jgi:hypothetical protein
MSHSEFPQNPDPARLRAESIDACRPQRQDWEDEEIAENLVCPEEDAALALSMELDTEIQSAYHNVSMPADLEARLLARLSPKQPRSHWRRNALIGGLVTVTSVAAALLLAFAQWNETGEPDVDSLVAKVISVRSGAWQNTTPPIPCTAHLRYNVNLLGWMSVKLNGVQVTVFKVSIAGKKPAYVASYAGEAGSRSFPNQPHIGTQDYRYGVSHNDGMTHVLIVHGGEDDYRQFAQTSNGTA